MKHALLIPGSHPAMAVGRMLELKGIAYKRVDLMPVISKGVLQGDAVSRAPRSRRCKHRRAQDHRLAGDLARRSTRSGRSRRCSRPTPSARAAVEEAEVWGEKVLADGVRRILWNALRRDRRPRLRATREGAQLGVPIGLAVATAAPIIAAEPGSTASPTSPSAPTSPRFPGWLDRVDDWIAEGVLGGEQPNAADFQIAAALRLAMTLQDLRPAIADRPAGELAMRLIPDYPGDAPPVLPAEWLEPLRAPAAA